MASRPVRLHPTAYSVGWISALPIEAAAAAVILDETHDNPRRHAVNTDQYIFGRIGKHNVVIARLPSGQIGTNSAAAVAGRLTTTFPSVQFALLVGTGGGVPSTANDIRLGDVIIGHPHSQHGGVVQYDFAKTGPNGKMSRIGSLNTSPPTILNAIATMRANYYLSLGNVATHLSVFQQLPHFRQGPVEDELYQSTYCHTGGDTCGDCDKSKIINRSQRATKDVFVHYGTIASGNQVMRDGVTRDEISNELGGVLCFEMEAAGLANTIPCVVVRGICDYADSHKNKSWQPYAASTSAAVAKELLLLIPAAETRVPSMETDTNTYRVQFSLRGVPIGNFAERPEDMKKLEQTLIPNAHSSESRRKVFVLHGLGGIGKTQLAVEFARKHQAKFTAVFWLDGTSEESLRQSIRDSMNRISKEDTAETNQRGDLDTRVHLFTSWLSISENKSWLLIFDNVDRDFQEKGIDPNAYDITKYIPDADHGSVLITTRLSNLRYLGDSSQLEKVGTCQALAIFRQWYDRDFDADGCKVLLELLNGLPLALVQAAAYMNETGASFDVYTRMYKEQWKRLMETTDVALSYPNRGLGMTWAVSYSAIRKKDIAAATLLLLWAHLDKKELPFSMLQVASEMAHSHLPCLEEVFRNEIKFLETMRLLCKYSLVESEQGSSSYSIHPVVHEWAYHIQDEPQKTQLSCFALLIVAHVHSKRNREDEYQLQLQLYPHAEALIERVGEDLQNLQDLQADSDLHIPASALQIGILMHDRGRLETATKIYLHALNGRERQSDLTDIPTLNTIMRLGNIYARQHKLDEAEKMLQCALEGYKKVAGTLDESTLRAAFNLGRVYAVQGKLSQANRLFRIALASKGEAAEPNSLSRARAFEGLGEIYCRQGKFEKADQMFNLALEGYCLTLGHDTIYAFHVIDCLGSLYYDQGKLAKAKDMFNRSLKGRERVLGPGDATILYSIKCLVHIHAHQGDLEQARELLQERLEKLERLIGPDNADHYPHLLETIHSFGWLQEKKGHLLEARTMYNKALKGCESLSKPNHGACRKLQEGLTRIEQALANDKKLV